MARNAKPAEPGQFTDNRNHPLTQPSPAGGEGLKGSGGSRGLQEERPDPASPREVGMHPGANPPGRDAGDISAEDALVEDYGQNMFAEGNNRTSRDSNARNAPDYDRAAHRPGGGVWKASPDSLPPANDGGMRSGPSFTSGDVADLRGSGNPARPEPLDTGYSRDGTGAAGRYDETGGPLGGDREEVDDIESGGFPPVDRNPRMKG